MNTLAEWNVRGQPISNLTCIFFDAVSQRRFVAFLTFLMISVLVRSSILGDWNYEIDVQFYMLAAERILSGAMLYVDVWDRKPPALFLAYATLARFQNPILAVQLAGAACTAAAAYGIHRVALTFTGPRGGVLAGLAYCVVTMEFGGATSQAPIVYAPLMVAAVWSIATSLSELSNGRMPRRVIAGIGCAGLAAAFKQSALLEGMSFGLVVVFELWRGGSSLARLAIVSTTLALVGALPLILAGAWYLANGHFSDLWQALVLSNVSRQYPDGFSLLIRYSILARVLAPISLFAVMGVLAMRPLSSLLPCYRFAMIWLGAAVTAVLTYPGLYLHYALPLLLPLCLVAAPFFNRHDIGLSAFTAFSVATLIHAGAFNFSERAKSRQASAEVTRYIISESPHRRILAWDSSPWLYSLVKSTPPTPLIFPPHLYEGGEIHTTGLDTTVELRRVLAWRPEVVIAKDLSKLNPRNEATMALVNSYVQKCSRARRFTLYDYGGPETETVYSGCADG